MMHKNKVYIISLLYYTILQCFMLHISNNSRYKSNSTRYSIKNTKYILKGAPQLG